MQNKKCLLVTGGNGFIAYYVIREALNRGKRVITNIQETTFKYEKDFAQELASGDLRVYMGVDIKDAPGVYHLVERADEVIHLAGLLGTKSTKDCKKFFEVNVFGATNVLEACEKYHLPVVFIGVGNYFENNDYSNSKYAAERELLKWAKYNGVKGNVVRALNAVGERQKVINTGKILPTFVTKAINGEDITVFGGEKDCSRMDLIYAGDVAKVLLEVLDKTASGEMAPASNTYEAGTAIDPTVWEIAQWVIDAVKRAGIDTKSKVVEMPMRPGESKGSRVVATNPYPMEYADVKAVIDEAVQWYINNPWE